VAFPEASTRSTAVISHVFVGVSDFERALRFYSAVMEALGHAPRFCDRSRPWAGWQPADGGRPLLLIGHPFDGAPHSAGNGAMLALGASSREVVQQVHALALTLGGVDEGEPRLRPWYHADYFGAYFRDPDGNKLCVVCHLPE
jgi:catechol 2,3-dioxygenase-like lactoylglutathione lyase family enzyme